MQHLFSKKPQLSTLCCFIVTPQGTAPTSAPVAAQGTHKNILLLHIVREERQVDGTPLPECDTPTNTPGTAGVAFFY